MNTPEKLKPPLIVIVLRIVALLLFIFAACLLFKQTRTQTDWLMFSALGLGGIITLAIASLIAFTHAAAERLAAIEAHLQAVVNERK